MPALDKEILETTHGIVCITMMDKGYADNIATNTNKYEAVYPSNVLAGSSAHIYDTILYEEAYRVPPETYGEFEEGSLAHKYTYMHLPTRSADDTHNKTHPIFYPVPPLTADYDRKTVVVNAYLKLPPPDGGSDIQRRVYIPLFNAQTGEAVPIVNRSFIKLQVCNEAHLRKYKLGPQYCTDATDMSIGGRYLLGTINTLTYGDNHQEYPLKVNFKNAAIRSSEEIRRDDLQLDLDKTWEIGVTRVTYNMSESNMIMIPHPTVAKQHGVYDLYAGEIMIGACMYYPIVSSDDMKFGFQSMGIALRNLYGLDATHQSDWITWSNDNFGRLYTMIDDLHKQLNNPATVDTWYATDFTAPYDASYNGSRCPVFRWNYADVLLAKYAERFQIHNNKFGLFSLREIVDLECISSADKANAQQWAEAYKVTGWHWRWQIVGRNDWANVAHSLPTFTLLDHINQGTEQSITKYCVKIQPKFGTVYVALGSRMSKMFGYTPVGKTQNIMATGASTTVIRKSLNIIYSCVRESYITLCQITARSYALAPIAPRPWTHDSSAPAPGNSTKTLLWSLPKLQTYRQDFQTYYYLPATPAYTLSDAVLDTINGDDIFVYTNVLPITNHIGNHLSPLLVQIPCPAHMFGENRMTIPYKDLADKTRITVSKTWDIQNPQFRTLSPGVNLDDMVVSVSNSYGDRLHLGVLDIQIIIREKQTSDNT